MCLAVPMKLVSITNEESAGVVELWGVKRRADLTMVMPVSIGEYLLIHAGFAIEKLDEDEAAKSLAVFEEMKEHLEDLIDGESHDIRHEDETKSRFIDFKNYDNTQS